MRRKIKPLLRLFLAAADRLRPYRPLPSDGSAGGRILIVDTAALGDCVCSLPAVNAIVRRFSGAVCDWAVAQGSVELASAVGGIGRVIPVRGDGVFSVAWSLRRTRYDLVVLPRLSLRDSLLSLLVHAGARAGYLLDPGLVEGRGVSISPVESPDHLHLVDARLRVARALGSSADGGRAGREDFSPLPLLASGSRIEPGAPFSVAFCPFSRWPSKNWPAERFVELAAYLKGALRRVKVYLLGSQAQFSQSLPIERGIGPGCVNLTGKTSLAEMVRVLNRCRLVVSVDSAPMHIASVLGVPLLALFGPTDPRLCGPYFRDAGTHVVTSDFHPAPGTRWDESRSWVHMQRLPTEKVIRQIEPWVMNEAKLGVL